MSFTRTSVAVLAAAGIMGATAVAAAAQAGEEPPLCLGKEATIVGTDGDDFIEVTGAHEVVWAGAGNDEVRLESGPGEFGHTVCAGEGDDVVIGSDKTDIIHGGRGDDRLVGDTIAEEDAPHAGDIIFAGFGDDLVDGGSGIDTIDPGPNTDIIVESPNWDILSYEGISLPIRVEGDGRGSGTTTGRGNDTFAGIDTVIGGNNGDHISGILRMVGGPGKDVLRGTDGGHDFYGGPGADRIYGVPGTGDRVIYELAERRVVVDLKKGRAWGEGRDRLFDIDHVVGSRFGDLLMGNGNRNEMFGGAGPDEIRGNRNADIIFGGPGHDVMYGKKGNDALYGGKGRDRAHGGRGRDTCVAEFRRGCEF